MFGDNGKVIFLYTEGLEISYENAFFWTFLNTQNKNKPNFVQNQTASNNHLVLPYTWAKKNIRRTKKAFQT